MLMQQQPQMHQQPRKLILQAQIVPQHQQEVQVQALQEVQPHQQVEPQPQRHDEVVFSFILFVTSNHQTTNLTFYWSETGFFSVLDQ